MGMAISLFITLTNFVLDSILYELVDYMKNPTVAHFKFRYVAFSIVGKFVNTSLIALAMQFLLYHDYYGSSGLFAYMAQLLTINAAISFLKNVFYVPVIKRWALIFLQKTLNSLGPEDQAKLQAGGEGGYVNMLQGELNRLYELPVFPIEQIYTSSLNVVYSALFFSWGSPYLSLIALVQFGLEQLLYRWHYAALSSKKHHIDISFSWEVAIYFEFGLLAFALGNYIFPTLLHRPYSHGLALAQVIVVSLYLAFVRFVPENRLQKLLCQEVHISQTGYHEDDITESYEMCNPSYP